MGRGFLKAAQCGAAVSSLAMVWGRWGVLPHSLAVERRCRNCLLVLFPFYLLPPMPCRAPWSSEEGPRVAPRRPPRPAPTRGCSAPAVLPLPAGTLRVDSSWKTSVSLDLQDRPKKDQLWGTVAAQHVALVKAACKYRSWLPFCSSVEEWEFFLKQRHKI